VCGSAGLNLFTAMRLRFPVTARLTRSSEFARVRSEGRAFHGKAMVVSVLRGVANQGTRVGFVTSRKVGGAVVRNRARRRLREVVRADRPQLLTCCWIVIIAKTAAATAPFPDVQNEWRNLAKRAGVLLLDL
jgi:ribonuclease P protein component